MSHFITVTKVQKKLAWYTTIQMKYSQVMVKLINSSLYLPLENLEKIKRLGGVEAGTQTEIG